MKKLFGCVCVCQIFLPVLLLLCTITGVKANNIRVEGKTRVVSIVNDTAVIEVTLRWDNSWRDDFNWDAAWVFFKFKKRGLENPWQHAYLSSSGHVLSTAAGNEGGGYAYMVGANAGKVNGLYIMRNGISEGNVSVRLQAKWPLNGTGLTKSDFGDALNGIYVAVHAIEMVYIPYNSYYLGDGKSNLCFHEVYGAERNPIRLNGYESLDASSVYGGDKFSSSYGLQNAIDNNMGNYYHSAGTTDEWFMIDFGTKKEMHYFTISTYYSGTDHFVEGSDDGVNWFELWRGSGYVWTSTLRKYKITNPGSYRYYRFRETGNYLVIYDVALWERDVPVLLIDSEDLLYYAVDRNNLSEKLQLPAVYPKGYAGFYVMKYETSQEQYVEFLNSLTLEQQKARVTNNNFSTMKRGDYVFGDLKNPSCRNGIVFIEQRKANTPVVFGNNLNPANDLFSTDDGQTLACNYMSIEDMIAYCSWSGLRPMSELEYEKACRRPYPQLPESGEYAWNTSSGVSALSSLGDLAYVGDEREQAKIMAKNVNSGTANGVNGPVRCGLFATSATNQTQAGATYWGVMEMSGNLKELCANINYSYFDGGSCGTGVYNPALWNTYVGYYGVRGGGFNSVDSLLRTSDRTEVMNYFTSITQRDSTVGFRGVYSLSGIEINGGEISAPDTGCWGGTNITNVQEAFCPDFPNVRFQYMWYVKKPGEAKYDIVNNATGQTLEYDGFENTTTSPVVYTFRRTGICALGVAESNEVTVKILPKPFAQDSYEFNAGSSVTLTQYWGTNASAQWWLDGAPSWAYISGTTANSLTVAGGLANLEFVVKGKLAVCPQDEFSATVRINNTFAYTGHPDSVTLVAGEYNMECWGAEGGRGVRNGEASYYGGNGAYVYGTLSLASPRVFYVYVGRQGYSGARGSCSGASGGWNGGGSGGGDSNCDKPKTEEGAGGGGASDIRLEGGGWSGTTSLRSRIMVAAGGGGGSSNWSGGSGGILSGSSGGGGATAGSQTGGYTFGYGGSGGYNKAGGGGGGGGYRGGYGGCGGKDYNYSCGGAGGSSFISGHSGCDAIDASGNHTGQPNHYSGFVFTNTGGTAGARVGNGQVCITPVN